MSVGAVNKQTGDRIPTAGMPAIDNALDLTSVNPVQNAVITAALAGKQNTLTFDDVPTANSNNPVKSSGVKSAIDAAVASAYHHAGTKTCAELVAGLLVAANEGNVYNITDSGTTTADFIDGAGQPIKAGDNVGIAKISAGVYKFDLLSGFVDTTNFVQKSQTAGLLKNDGTVDTTIQGDVDSLKSGLTNYENQNNLNLEVPNRKNVLPITLTAIKAANTVGTWSGNSYTLNDVTFTVNTDVDGNVTGITANGTASAEVRFNYPNSNITAGSYIITGTPPAGSSTTYRTHVFNHTSSAYVALDSGSGASFTLSDTSLLSIFIIITNGVAISNITFYPMIRPATITDPTFAPYVPSVESRIEAVESGLTNTNNNIATLATDLSGIKIKSFELRGSNNGFELLGTAFQGYLIFGQKAILASVMENNGGTPQVTDPSGKLTVAAGSNPGKLLVSLAGANTQIVVVSYADFTATPTVVS